MISYRVFGTVDDGDFLGFNLINLRFFFTLNFFLKIVSGVVRLNNVIIDQFVQVKPEIFIYFAFLKDSSIYYLMV